MKTKYEVLLHEFPMGESKVTEEYYLGQYKQQHEVTYGQHKYWSYNRNMVIAVMQVANDQIA